MIKTRNLYNRGKVRGVLSLYFPPPFKVSGPTTQNMPETASNRFVSKGGNPEKP
ncbi:hypothetical protein [Desulfofundulus sp.]|uniref:hypothetical protein n=1 Tax=Desulfofundulus sp. TaxID=2282750 RepID=UPI003C713A0B